MFRDGRDAIRAVGHEAIRGRLLARFIPHLPEHWLSTAEVMVRALPVDLSGPTVDWEDEDPVTSPRSEGLAAAAKGVDNSRDLVRVGRQIEGWKRLS